MMNENTLSQLRQIERSVSAAPEPEAGVDVITSGVFRAFLSQHTAYPELNYAMIVAMPDRGQTLAAAIATLRAVFVQRGRRLRLEFMEELWPELAPAAEQAGLRLVNREPLLTCTPASFQPVAAPGVRVRFLAPQSSEADLAVYLTIRDEQEGPVDHAEVLRFRDALSREQSWYALASLDDVPAGTGRCSVSHEELGELTAIVTRADVRRRGIAATTTSALVREYFGAGGHLAWLTAAIDEATSVYRRVGFSTIGHLLNYEDPAS